MMQQEIFQNVQIDLSLLPSAGGLDWKPLQQSYRRLLLLSVGLWCAVLIAGITIAIPVTQLPTWVPLLAYAVVIVFSLLQVIFIIKGFPYKGYALRMHDILYKTGWLYKKQIAVPFNRIQHVDIRQGVFERAFGLSKLNIYTAGGQGSDITIPGLLDEEAQHLKEYILRKTTAQDEEE
ncbi:MAG TPA: PH domain-containing protein [Saprospiraceae bacterium]|nr:PH domain-containing protein [Saprospiraceae bacterium]